MVHFLNGLSFCEELLWDDISAVWKGTNCCWYNTHRKWCGSFCWLSEMVVFMHQFLVMSSSPSPSPAPILERLPYCQPLEFWSTHYPRPSLAMPSASTASNLASKFAFFIHYWFTLINQHSFFVLNSLTEIWCRWSSACQIIHQQNV